MTVNFLKIKLLQKIYLYIYFFYKIKLKNLKFTHKFFNNKNKCKTLNKKCRLLLTRVL